MPSPPKVVAWRKAYHLQRPCTRSYHVDVKTGWLRTSLPLPWLFTLNYSVSPTTLRT